MWYWRLLVVGLFFLSSCSYEVGQHSSVNLDPDGVSVRIVVENLNFCVHPRHVEAQDLLRYRENGSPITTFPTRGAVPLAFFSETLNGYSDAQYSSGVTKLYDKRKYPTNWIRVRIGHASEWAKTKVSIADYNWFNDETIDSIGFKSKSRDPNCVGKTITPYTALKHDKTCVEKVLKYGHSFAPDEIILCRKERCFQETATQVGGAYIKYDFPKTYLDKWRQIHEGLIDKVKLWREDSSCFNRELVSNG